AYAENAYRLGQVLQVLLADVLERDLGLAAYMIEHGPGDENTPRLGQRLEPRGDIHAVAVEGGCLGHHVADIDADAQHDLPMLGPVGVRDLHAPLQLDCAGDRIHGAGELDQHPVAHQLDDAPMILDDERLEDLPAPVHERGQSACLVKLHQSAIADHVRGK